MRSMSTTVWITTIGLTLLQLVMTTGCSAVPFRGGAQSQAAPPPLYRAAQGIAILAELNKSATATVINLNKMGKISDENTADVLGYTELVAQSCRSAALVIQDKTKSDIAKMKVVLALTQQASPPASLISKLNLGSGDMLSLSSIFNSMSLVLKTITSALA